MRRVLFVEERDAKGPGALFRRPRGLLRCRPPPRLPRRHRRPGAGPAAAPDRWAGTTAELPFAGPCGCRLRRLPRPSRRRPRSGSSPAPGPVSGPGSGPRPRAPAASDGAAPRAPRRCRPMGAPLGEAPAPPEAPVVAAPSPPRQRRPRAAALVFLLLSVRARRAGPAALRRRGPGLRARASAAPSCAPSRRRATPIPVWAQVALGDAGKLEVAVHVDGTGHITSAEPRGREPAPGAGEPGPAHHAPAPGRHLRAARGRGRRGHRDPRAPGRRQPGAGGRSGLGRRHRSSTTPTPARPASPRRTAAGSRSSCASPRSSGRIRGHAPHSLCPSPSRWTSASPSAASTR